MNTLGCIALLSLIVLVLLMNIKKREGEGYIAPTSGYVGGLWNNEPDAAPMRNQVFDTNVNWGGNNSISNFNAVPEVQQVAQNFARGGSLSSFIQSHAQKNPNY